MRQQFIPTDAGNFDDNQTPATGLYIDSDGDRFNEMPKIVTHDAPWASVAVEVDGGFMVFESQSDYDTWSNQQ